MFVPGKPFQPSQMFAGKARAYPSEAPFKVGVNYRQKSVITLAPGNEVYQLFRRKGLNVVSRQWQDLRGL